jgi:hypothetical protein
MALSVLPQGAACRLNWRMARESGTDGSPAALRSPLHSLLPAGGKWDDYKQAGDRWQEMSLKR